MKGQKKLGTIKHEKSGIEVDYYLEGVHFIATVFEEKLREPNASILRNRVLERIDCWLSFEWMPIIKIEIGDGGYFRSRSDDGISFEHERFYIAKGPAGTIVKVDWDVDEEHRKAKCTWGSDSILKLTQFPFTAPLETRDGWLVPYTPEAWQAIADIKKGIKTLKRRLEEILTTREGIKKLIAGGARLLITEGKK